MIDEKICSCDLQSNIKHTEAIDFINQAGKIYARYHRDCAVHGFKRLTESETQSE